MCVRGKFVLLGLMTLVGSCEDLQYPHQPEAKYSFRVILGDEWIALGLGPGSTFISSKSRGIDPFCDVSIQDRRR